MTAPLIAAIPCFLAAALIGLPTQAQVQVGPGDDLGAAINGLAPGDELVLSGGDYLLTARLGIRLAGTPDQLITIRSADGERAHLHRPDAAQNIIDIDSAEHVVVRGIEFSGGSAGIRIRDARFLTIEDCEVHHTGDVAIRANDNDAVYESLAILRNNLHHTSGTGEGMYLGCNHDRCRVLGSLIEGNYVHHTDGESVRQGDGIELKEGSAGNVVRDNVIHDTKYPCILTYSTAGNGGPNVIERNLMWNCGDHGIQAAADAVIRNNIILSSGADGIAMQPHQSGRPSNLHVIHNTILHPTNNAISLRNVAGPVVIANNALFARRGEAVFVRGGDGPAPTIASNIGTESRSGGVGRGDLGRDLRNGHFDGEPPMDVYPTSGSALIGAGDPSHTCDDDFNGTTRGGPVDVGAYAFGSTENPGWPLGPAPKPPVVEAPSR